jgi:hypothetical protein
MGTLKVALAWGLVSLCVIAAVALALWLSSAFRYLRRVRTLGHLAAVPGRASAALAGPGEARQLFCSALVATCVAEARAATWKATRKATEVAISAVCDPRQGIISYLETLALVTTSSESAGGRLIFSNLFAQLAEACTNKRIAMLVIRPGADEPRETRPGILFLYVGGGRVVDLFHIDAEDIPLSWSLLDEDLIATVQPVHLLDLDDKTLLSVVEERICLMRI